jgi:hypothetical protein
MVPWTDVRHDSWPTLLVTTVLLLTCQAGPASANEAARAPVTIPLTTSAALASPATLLWWPVRAACEVHPAPYLLPALTTVSGALLVEPADSTRIAAALQARGEPGTWTQWSARVAGATAITPAFMVGATGSITALQASGASLSAAFSLDLAAHLLVSERWSVGAAIMDVGASSSSIIVRAAHIPDPDWVVAADVATGVSTSMQLTAQWKAHEQLLCHASVLTSPQRITTGAALRVTDTVSVIAVSAFSLDLGLIMTLGVQWSAD